MNTELAFNKTKAQWPCNRWKVVDWISFFDDDGCVALWATNRIAYGLDFYTNSQSNQYTQRNCIFDWLCGLQEWARFTFHKFRATHYLSKNMNWKMEKKYQYEYKSFGTNWITLARRHLLNSNCTALVRLCYLYATFSSTRVKYIK